MATLTNPLPPLVFPHEIDNISIEQTDKEDCVVTIEVSGVAVFSSTLYFYEIGFIELRQIADLLRTHIKDMAREVKIKLDGVVVATTTCLPCRVNLSERAASFCPDHFLTCVLRAKRTTPTSTEYVSFYNPGEQFTARLYAKVVRDNQMENILIKEQGYKTKGIHTFSFNVRDTEAIYGDDLIAMSVEVGKRKQNFTLHADTDTGMEVKFRNAFGRWESFYFPETERKFIAKPESVIINGERTLVQLKSEIEHKCFSGQLSLNTLGLFADLCHSERIEDKHGTKYVISSVDFGTKSNLYEARQGYVTLKEAAKTATFRPQRDANTFDATFDNTFK